MTRIHGLAYLIIGAMVVLFSFRLPQLQLFLWVGIIFVIFGIVRLIMDKSSEPRSKPVPKHRPKPMPQQNQQQIAKHFCSYCGTTVHGFQNFCHHCGQRLFHKR